MQNLKIEYDPHFWEGKIFGILERGIRLYILLLENFNEIALSWTVKEIQTVLCFTEENC